MNDDFTDWGNCLECGAELTEDDDMVCELCDDEIGVERIHDDRDDLPFLPPQEPQHGQG